MNTTSKEIITTNKNLGKIKLDRFRTMGQFSWHNFSRTLEHYDFSDAMHMMCPQEKWMKGMDLSAFIINVTPGVPFDHEDKPFADWRKQIDQIRQWGKPFDFWAVFHGTKRSDGPGYEMHHCQMPREEYEYMMEQVGDLFLGWELGEFDGHFARDVISYMKPEDKPKTRREGHDQMMAWLRNRHEMLYGNTKSLCGCTFPHYLNELSTRMLGAEIGQALLNTQVYVSFLRGACKQYDLQYNLITSVFDRWGHRCYTKEGDQSQEAMGGVATWPGTPHHGHSVGFFNATWTLGYFAEAISVGVEGGFFTDELTDGVRHLSPLGQAFHDFTKWSRDPHPCGKQLRPVAMMLDYYAGWTPPRHLYSFEERVVWHCIPYGPSDHAMDQAYELFYPGYTKSGYYRDERGFITPTPLGESVDVLLSDAASEIMAEYPIIWLFSDVKPDEDFAFRLKSYVEGGGHLIGGGAAMTQLIQQWFEASLGGDLTPSFESILKNGNQTLREANYAVRTISSEEQFTIHAQTEAGLPLIVSWTMGEGKITFLTADHGLTNDMTAPGFDMIKSLEFRPDPPFELLHVVQQYIQNEVKKHLPITVTHSQNIYFSTNETEPGVYVVCLYNPGHETWEGEVMASGQLVQPKPLEGPWDKFVEGEGGKIKLRSNQTTVLEVRCSRKS